MARLPDEVVAAGGDLRPATLLSAYRRGIFPMHVPVRGRGPVLCWWSPDPRGVIDVDSWIASRSVRRARRHFSIRVDSAFADVVEGCADSRRPHGWINDDIRTAYGELHRLGHAHSVEAWRDGALEGGLYGVASGGLFAAESMYHRATGASTAAVAGLIEILAAAGPDRLVDVQWLTPHLQSLGAVEVSRRGYLARLEVVLALRDAAWGAQGTTRE